MTYFVLAIDYGRRGIEAIVRPEDTRRQIVSEIRDIFADSMGRRIAFVHHVHDGICEDVTEELIEDGEQQALQAAE